MLEFNINLIQLINFSAVVNGFVFCTLLLTKKENSTANCFLALMLFSASFTLAIGLVLELKLYNRYPWLHLFPFTMTYWIGPAFYFYIKKLVTPDFKFNKSHWWHFSFILLNYIHSVYHLIFGRNFPYPQFHNFTEAVGTYALIPLLIYLFFAYRSVISYQKSILNQLSTTDDVRLTWIKWFIKGVALIFIVLTLLSLIDFEELIDYTVESSDGLMYQFRDYIFLILGLAIYWVSIAGFRQSQTINDSKPLSNSSLKDYSKVIEKLTEAMNEKKLYLDSSLNLQMLCDATQLSEKEISIALNQHLKKNFYYFINEFRVEEAKQRLEDPKFMHLKILSIAIDSGFNSKATFNRMFKELTGKSPKEFRPNN